ncbi:ComEA family DNA-binding protein, partial [Neisseria meningitidis]|nr:ComEA family DNA-binding protein [Neisseria meningitidis]
KTMKKMFVLFCMLFSCAFSLAAVNINAASQQELEALPGIGPAKAKLKDQASVGAPAPKGPAKPVLPAVKK